MRSTPETRARRFVNAWQALDRAAASRHNAEREFEAAARAIAERDGINFIFGLEMRDVLYQYECGCAPDTLTHSNGRPHDLFPHLNQGETK